ncbi:MAG: hypothetical protein ACLTYW_06710 [Collinsella sp.]
MPRSARPQGRELVNGLLVNSAFAILRLGIATTLVTGAAMVASGQVDFWCCLPSCLW